MAGGGRQVRSAGLSQPVSPLPITMAPAVARLTNLRLHPLAWVGGIAAVSALVRLVIAFQVEAPVYYPDEYLSTAIARSITEGDFGQARGGSLTATYTSYFVPLVQAPIWMIDDVDVAFRLSQALGAIVFGLAAFPAFVLSRRLGISDRGSLVVASLALIIPAGVFTATLLAEPYAYPLFLLVVLAVVNALSQPSALHHLIAITGVAGLCVVGGLQFLYFGIAYMAAWLLTAFPSRRTFLRRSAILLAAGSALLLLVLASGQGQYVDVLVGAVRYPSYPLATLASWLTVNAFVLAVAAGWLIVPGAVLGLRALGRSRSPYHVAFAALTVLLVVGMLFEAALWGANDFGVYERFTFYGAPLLVTAFVWAAEQTTPSRLPYASIAYVGALAAVLLPVTDPLFAADDQHSPTIDGLSELTFGSEIGGGIWAPVLALLAVGVAWRGATNPRVVLILTASVCIVAGIGASHVFVRVTSDRDAPPLIRAASDSSLLTWQGADPYLVLDALFWNPEITRVVRLGAGRPADGLPSTPAQFVPPGRLVNLDGTPLSGPFVIASDVVVAGGRSQVGAGSLATLAEVPPLIGFGFDRQTGELGRAGRIFVAAGAQPRRVIVRTRSRSKAVDLGLTCTSGLAQRLAVGSTPVSVDISVPAGSTDFCDLYVIPGAVQVINGHQAGVEVNLALYRHGSS